MLDLIGEKYYSRSLLAFDSNVYGSKSNPDSSITDILEFYRISSDFPIIQQQIATWNKVIGGFQSPPNDIWTRRDNFMVINFRRSIEFDIDVNLFLTGQAFESANR